MAQGYYDRAQRRVVDSLLRDAKDLLEDTQRLTLPNDVVISTLYAIGDMFTRQAQDMENG